jgi:tetratricopeptide (TPR) repeat protein
VDNARKAVAVSPQNFGAQYQLGLALAAAKDFPGSAAAFEQAAKINPSFAYAHYYAGMARYSARQVDRMAAHFKTFAKLAPMAPERPAVENIMRTLGGR